MERIMIIGSPGSGKSTLAIKLGKKLNLPVVHLDKLFWNSGWVESSREELDEKIRAAMNMEKWIMDGNYSRTMEMRLERADGVIYLDLPRIVCLWSVLKRVVRNYGQVREDMPEGCPERLDVEFLRFVWDFNGKNREKIYGLLKNADGRKIIIIKSRRAAKKFLEEIKKTPER